MVTVQSPWRHPPRISREKFASLLRAYPPYVERDPTIYYDSIRAKGVDPLFILAMFWHESKFGREGWAAKTKSWGNTRPPSFGPDPVGAYNQDTGAYYNWWGARPTPARYLCAYRTWLDGCDSTVARLVASEWYYHDRTTIEEIFRHPSGKVWAPAGDHNDPEGYLNSVVAFMNKHTEDKPMNALAQVATRQSSPMLAWGARNHGHAIMRGQWPSYITIHETGNRARGANAEMHRKFVLGGGGEHEVSFHAVVDEKESIQLMPWNWVAWHASDGNGDGNHDSIAIETCQNEGANFAMTVRNLAVLTAGLMVEFDIPLHRVVQHNHWAPDKKNCPEFLRAGRFGQSWAGFKAGVAALNESLRSVPTNPRPEGFLQPIVDSFNWGPDSAGIIIERTIVVFNPEMPEGRQWYRGTWHHERGISWEVIG